MSRSPDRRRAPGATVTEKRPLVHIVAAVARNRVIGAGGRMPWHLPEDLRHFRALTTGHPVVMGRKTRESIGSALPGRENIVVTRDSRAQFSGARTVPTLSAAIDAAGAACEVFVIGGGEVYRAALETADRMTLTELAADFEGDTWFPEFDRQRWIETERTSHESRAGMRFDIVRYERRHPSPG